MTELLYTVYPDEDENRLSKPLKYRITIEETKVILWVEAFKKLKRKGIEWTQVKVLHSFSN